MTKVALDNDIVAKCATYSLLSEIANALGVALEHIGVLGTLLFVIKEKRLRTAAIGAGPARQAMKDFVAAVETLEPSDEESRLAAKLEEAAIRANLQFDIGESQLCAIVVCRQADLLCTGDKRAIRAAEQLVKAIDEITYLKKRILPFEGLVRRMMDTVGYPQLKASICGSRGTDIALEMCFQCHRDDGDPVEAFVGFESYLNTIQRAAPEVAIPG